MGLGEYVGGGFDPGVAPRVAAMLRAAAWAWPEDGTPAWRRLAELDLPETPLAPPGHAPILAEQPGGCAVLVFSASGPVGALRVHRPQESVLAEVRRIRAEVGRHLPVRPLHGEPAFHCIDADSCGTERLPPLHGKSLGLSVALAIAGRRLDLGIPADLAFSAEIGPRGSLAGVGGWEEKARAVAAYMPRVRSLLVAPGDVGKARAALAVAGAAARVGVEGIADLAGALARVFGAGARRDVVLHAPEAERGRLLDRFFANALNGVSSFVRWGPPADILDAVGGWQGLDPRDRGRREMAFAIAARYAGRQEPPRLPAETWFRSLTGPVRMQVAAHVFQHHTRWPGEPGAWELEVLEHARTLGSFPDCLKVRGAWARTQDVRGAHAAAHREHRAVVEGWIDAHDLAGASYSLAEWMRLAGALGDTTSFADAVKLEEHLEDDGAFGPIQTMYLDVGKALGAWALRASGNGDHCGVDPEVEIGAFLAGPPDRPNFEHLRRKVIRLRALLRHPTEGGTDPDRGQLDPIDLHLLRLHGSSSIPDGWLESTLEPHRWRAAVLVEQARAKGVTDPALHVLRFFVDA